MFTFVETSVFSRALPKYLDDEAYAALQVYLDRHPDAGNVVPGPGGVRKLRRAAGGRGTRGGLRVIYYLQPWPRRNLAADPLRPGYGKISQ